jgi:two-component system sensor histidine kinase MprB
VKLRTRIALIASSAVAVAVVLASVGAYFAARNELRDQVDESLIEVAGQARGIAGLATTLGGIPGYGRGRIFQPRTAFDAVYVQALLLDGRAVYPSEQELALPIDEGDVDVVTGGEMLLRDVSVGRHLRMITVSHDLGAVQIARSLDEVDETLKGLTLLLALVGIGGVGLAAGLGLVVARGALGPIGRLTEAAEHVAETQELGAYIETDRDDEVGRLAAAFNSMLAALEESRRQQHRLVHDAGHELRTPLTSLRTNIELLARADGMAGEQRKELLDDVTFELRELSNLVTEVVDLATDASTSEELLVDLDLDHLVERVVDRARRRTGHPIEVDLEETHLEGRKAMLERAVANLVDNAVKWSPDGEPVEIALHGGRLSVRDRGPGIADEDLPRVFDRFYRSESARGMPGSGLGLSIVKRIVGEHGGSVFIESTPGGGATVGFELPGAVGPGGGVR